LTVQEEKHNIDICLDSLPKIAEDFSIPKLDASIVLKETVEEIGKERALKFFQKLNEDRKLTEQFQESVQYLTNVMLEDLRHLSLYTRKEKYRIAMVKFEEIYHIKWYLSKKKDKKLATMKILWNKY
jgi:hypothetical protein